MSKLIDQNDRVEEVWFPGAHANVGGGLKDSTLSDIALRFMVSRAEELGVLFQEAASEIRCDLKGVSRTVLWKPGQLWKLLITRQVRVQSQIPEGLPRIHKSVFILKDAGVKYDPKNLPASYVREDRD